LPAGPSIAGRFPIERLAGAGAARAVAFVLLAFAIAGCGFHRTSSDYGGEAADLAGADLFGVAPADLATSDGNTAGGTGPGPVGALPTGFCCNSDDDCRSRNCAGLLEPVHYCTDECDHDSLCSAWGGDFKCDVNGTGYCVTATAPANCLAPSVYPYGTKPIGSCCQSGFDKSGQECLGGLCNATGPSSNPFYCTQGCDRNTPCPAPYVCNSASFCSLPDPNATYTCQ
jgi:hypothetical protein